MKTSRDWSVKKLRFIRRLVWEGIKFQEVKRGNWRVWRKEKLGKFGRGEKETGFGCSEARSQYNGGEQAQGNKEVL